MATGGTQFLVRPNPAHDIVTITAAAAIKEIACYPATGQLVKNVFPVSKRYKLSLKEFAAGVYTLQVIPEIAYIVKIVKEQRTVGTVIVVVSDKQGLAGDGLGVSPAPDFLRIFQPQV